MRSVAYSHLTDEQLFAEILKLRAERSSVDRPLGELVERWKGAARYVIRRIQASYGARSEDDELELFQEAVGKLLDKGLDQFRGISERLEGKSASPKTFFLRIVKHVAIDRYRRRREVLAAPPEGEEDDAPPSREESQVAMDRARASEERESAQSIYWRAFERLQEEHPKEAEAWDLYHHQDVDDHDEVARRLNITVVNSYKRVSRAQAYLKLYVLDLEKESEG